MQGLVYRGTQLNLSYMYICVCNMPVASTSVQNNKFWVDIKLHIVIYYNNFSYAMSGKYNFIVMDIFFNLCLKQWSSFIL